MALPVTLSGYVWPTHNYYVGPFKSRAGNYYIFGWYSLTRYYLDVWKATDPTSSWTRQGYDSDNEVASYTPPLWCCQEGDVIHIAFAGFLADVAELGGLAYTSFDMSNDTWGATTEVDAAADLTTASCSIAVRSDGDIIILYNGARDSGYARVDYAYYNGSWTSGVAVDNGGATTHWYGSVIVKGDSDRMHFFFKNGSGNSGYQRCLRSNEVMESFPESAFDSSVNINSYICSPGVSYHDGTNQLVRCPYRDSTSNDLALVEFTSGDTPSPTTNTGVSDEAVQVANQGNLACMAVVAEDEYLLYVSSVDDDLRYDKNDGTDTDLIVSTVNRVSCNGIERDGPKVGYVYDDNGTTKYNEIDVAITISTLSGALFGDQNSYWGPFTK
jgi:hypothetical protein